jgi:hypothetical protein
VKFAKWRSESRIRKQTQRVFKYLKGHPMRDLTPEQIQAWVWAAVVLGVLFVLVFATAGIIYSVTFVDHDLEKMAPIDEIYTGILKDVMLLAIGVISGVAGTKVVK